MIKSLKFLSILQRIQKFSTKFLLQEERFLEKQLFERPLLEQPFQCLLI